MELDINNVQDTDHTLREEMFEGIVDMMNNEENVEIEDSLIITQSCSDAVQTNPNNFNLGKLNSYHIGLFFAYTSIHYFIFR